MKRTLATLGICCLGFTMISCAAGPKAKARAAVDLEAVAQDFEGKGPWVDINQLLKTLRRLVDSRGPARFVRPHDPRVRSLAAFFIS